MFNQLLYGAFLVRPLSLFSIKCSINTICKDDPTIIIQLTVINILKDLRVNCFCDGIEIENIRKDLVDCVSSMDKPLASIRDYTSRAPMPLALSQ